MSDDHAHHAEQPSHDDPTVGTTLIVGAVSVILLFAIVVALEVLYYRTVEAEHERKILAEAPEELRSVRSEQIEQLSTYRWVDQQNGIVAIPIDRAMERLVEEARRSGAPAGSGGP